MIKILVTSIGSLVGQNIIDVLEYEEFRRRDSVELIGINSLPDNPNNFKCDKFYLVPITSNETFIERMTEIISKVKPDIILCGRDEDTLSISNLLSNNRELSVKLPYGNVNSLLIAYDKYETWKFSKKHELPFADTFNIAESGSKQDLITFVNNSGFPLIAKPINGSASQGVFLINNWKHVEIISSFKNYILQEYLGDSKFLRDYLYKMDGLIPLFANLTGVFHHSCHSVIRPDGNFDRIFISRNEHNYGVTVSFKRDYLPELEEITSNFIEAVYREGGWGPITVQFRQDKNRNWKAQEINMRTNGNTFARFILGQDDIGLIVDYLFPDANFPLYKGRIDSDSFFIKKNFKLELIASGLIEKVKHTGEYIN